MEWAVRVNWDKKHGHEKETRQEKGQESPTVEDAYGYGDILTWWRAVKLMQSITG